MSYLLLNEKICSKKPGPSSFSTKTFLIIELYTRVVYCHVQDIKYTVTLSRTNLNIN